MTAQDNTSSVPATVPPVTETTAGLGSLDKTILKSEESHERPRSLSSNDTSDLEKQPADDGMSPAEAVQSNAESEYPNAKQTAAIMIALMLAIFLVALVRRPRRHT